MTRSRRVPFPLALTGGKITLKEDKKHTQRRDAEGESFNQPNGRLKSAPRPPRAPAPPPARAALPRTAPPLRPREARCPQPAAAVRLTDALSAAHEIVGYRLGSGRRPQPAHPARSAPAASAAVVVPRLGR